MNVHSSEWRCLGKPNDFPELSMFDPSQDFKFGKPEREYKGKRICVTGTIDEYRDVPQIETKEPGQIKGEKEPETVWTAPLRVPVAAGRREASGNKPPFPRFDEAVELFLPGHKDPTSLRRISAVAA